MSRKQAILSMQICIIRSSMDQVLMNDTYDSSDVVSFSRHVFSTTMASLMEEVSESIYTLIVRLSPEINYNYILICKNDDYLLYRRLCSTPFIRTDRRGHRSHLFFSEIYVQISKSVVKESASR